MIIIMIIIAMAFQSNTICYFLPHFIVITGCPNKIVPRLPEDCDKTAKDPKLLHDAALQVFS